MLIDTHTHLYPEKISTKVVELLREHYGLPVPHKGTINEYQQIKKQHNVKAAIFFTAATCPSQVPNANKWAKLNTQKGMIGFGTLHPDDENSDVQIKWLKEAGIKGIKFHPDFQQFFIDDEKALNLYEKLAKDFIVIFHVGDDNAPHKVHYSSPQRLNKVLDLVPGLKIIAAHMGGYQMWQDSLKYLCGKNLYFDTSSCAGILNDDIFRLLIKEHGYHKVLLGSDYPFSEPHTECLKLAKMGLNSYEYEAIIGKNAELLLSKLGI